MKIFNFKKLLFVMVFSASFLYAQTEVTSIIGGGELSSPKVVAKSIDGQLLVGDMHGLKKN